MEKDEIVADVKKKLGLDIEGNDIRTELQEGWLRLPFSFLKVLNWATSVSKTLPALRTIETKKTLILISQILHEENWRKEAKKWNIDLSTVTFQCYNSMVKHVDTKWDLIILDEGHRCSDTWAELLPSFDVGEILFLSATISNEVKKKLYAIAKPHFSTITAQDAVNWNILPEPEIKVVILNLDDAKYDQVFVKGKNKAKKTIECTYEEYQKTYKWLKGDKRPNMHIKCTEQQYHDLWVNDMDWIKQQAIKTKNEILWTRLKLLGSQRKTWLANLKTKHVHSLLKILEGERVVVFANDIEQAELFDKDAVHSKNKNGQVIIDEFNNFERDLLVSVRQLQESLNLIEPNNGIVVQLDGSKTYMTKVPTNIKTTQSLGRIFRSVSPKLYLFVYRGTQDETYYNDFKASLDENWFKEVKISEI